MLKIITVTQRLFFSQIINSIYFYLIVCCKTWEGGEDLEGPLFSNYSILGKFA